jgi:transposase-like protein
VGRLVRKPSRKELLYPTMRLKDLAAEYGVCYSTLWRWRRQAGAKCNTRGANHWNAKLTQQQVDEIRTLHEAGVEQKELAQRFGVAQNTIHDIVHYEAW